MKKYVTQNMIDCVIKNNIYPQDIDVDNSTTMYLIFGSCGLSLYRKSNRNNLYAKHINYWKTKTEKEINEELNNQEWVKEF